MSEQSRHEVVPRPGQPAPPLPESLAVIELASLAAGWRVTDAVVKRAAVRLLDSRAVSPGKFLLLFVGEVASVEEGYAAGLLSAGSHLVDSLRLPFAHAQLLEAATGRRGARVDDAVGVVEMDTVSAAFAAADATVKAVGVELLLVRMAQGLGGKGYFLFTGTLADVETGLEVAAAAVPAERLVETSLISAPTAEWIAALAAER